MKKKHALVIFSKFPEPGVTKTRLTEAHGGSLTPDEAAKLYRAMVLDTAATGLQGLVQCRRNTDSDIFDFFVSSSPADEMVRVKEMFKQAFPSDDIGYVVDQGENFDAHFNDCYRQIFDLGYHSVVCIGGDLPGLTPDMITRAFSSMSQLEAPSPSGAMVLAPCQAAGVSLVGITKTTRMDFTGVFYNGDGIAALDALMAIAAERRIPTALLETLSDVDYMEDLGHMISMINAMDYCSGFQSESQVPQRTLAFIRSIGLVTTTPPNTSHDPRSRLDG